jgi:hypothetical protein
VAYQLAAGAACDQVRAPKGQENGQETVEKTEARRRTP